MSVNNMSKDHGEDGEDERGQPTEDTPFTPEIIRTVLEIQGIKHIVTLTNLVYIRIYLDESYRSVANIRNANEAVIGKRQDRRQTRQSLERLRELEVVRRYEAPGDVRTTYYYELTQWGEKVAEGVGVHNMIRRFEFDNSAIDESIDRPGYLDVDDEMYGSGGP